MSNTQKSSNSQKKHQQAGASHQQRKRRHKNARSTRPRNEDHGSPSGQSKGEAYGPPPVIQAVKQTPGAIMPIGTAGEQHQHQQAISDPQNDSAVQPQQFKSSLRIRFDPIMPASSYQIEGQGGNTSIRSGTMEGSNTSPNESGTGAESTNVFRIDPFRNLTKGDWNVDSVTGPGNPSQDRD